MGAKGSNFRLTGYNYVIRGTALAIAADTGLRLMPVQNERKAWAKGNALTNLFN
jgi:hypothetical protein